MNWGYRITILYVLFVMFMLGMVIMTFQYKVNLVADDYYKQEMAYQDEINKMKNVRDLDQAPQFKYDTEGGLLWLDLKQVSEEGEIWFFRPSDGSQDFKIPLQTDSEGRQALAVEGLSLGLWRLKVNWRYQEQAYYYEQKIRISDQGVENLDDQAKSKLSSSL